MLTDGEFWINVYSLEDDSSSVSSEVSDPLIELSEENRRLENKVKYGTVNQKKKKRNPPQKKIRTSFVRNNWTFYLLH